MTELETRSGRNKKNKKPDITESVHEHDKDIEQAYKSQGYGYMCTAKEMYAYARENKLGFNLTPIIGKWLQLKHFELIENELGDNEEVLISFIGRHQHYHTAPINNVKENNENSNHEKVKYFKAEGFYAYAITTDARLIYAHWQPFKGNTMSIPLSNLNNVNPVTSFFWGHVKIETFGDTFCVFWTKNTVRRINKVIQKGVKDSRDGRMDGATNTLFGRRQVSNTQNQIHNQHNQIDMFAQLESAKKSMENGTITSEEYEKFKKRVLGE